MCIIVFSYVSLPKGSKGYYKYEVIPLLRELNNIKIYLHVFVYVCIYIYKIQFIPISKDESRYSREFPQQETAIIGGARQF